MTEARDFWSRRKERVAEEAEAEEAATHARTRAAEQAGKTDAEFLDELGLPDPEQLEPGDDFSAFMDKAVPEHLRRLALRRLWSSNPVLANVDGLVDYGEDFTDAACVIENLSTSYQVGKGMKAHVEEMARQAELEAAGEDEEGSEPEAGETEPEADEVQEEFLAEAADETEHVAEAFVPAEETDPAPRRRMRFSFHDDEVVNA